MEGGSDMETINGEWIMKGCDSSDPSALHLKDFNLQTGVFRYEL